MYRYLLILLLLSACSTKAPVTVSEQYSEKYIQKIVADGELETAAELYLRLSKNDRSNQVDYKLKATSIYIDLQDYKTADKTLKEISTLDLSDSEKLQWQLFDSQLKVATGALDDALQTLQTVDSSILPDSLKIRYIQTLIVIYAQKKSYFKEIKYRITLQDYLPSDDNLLAIWQGISKLTENKFNEARLNEQEIQLQGWLELTAIYQHFFLRTNQLRKSIDNWLERYKNHQAQGIIDTLITQSKKLNETPSKIGVLLPYTGTFSQQSAAIRDGFIAAWYLDQDIEDRPIIKFYDTTQTDVATLYQQAIDDGQDYIVGPLRKMAIQQIVSESEPPIKSLALNYAKGMPEYNNVTHFSLLPEDEARQVAEYALGDNHQRVFVIFSNAPWAKRVADAFVAHWIALGGELVDIKYFQQNSLDSLSLAVKTFFSKNKGTEDIPLPSPVDFIFAAVSAEEARQLMPQLTFHNPYETDIPVYATSQSFSGNVNQTLDQDLDGMIFTDMPWLLEQKRQLSIIQSSLNRHLSHQNSSNKRLYAFGIDAYRLSKELYRDKQRLLLDGETGLLSRKKNRIHHKLQRARFVNGVPLLLE